MRRLNLKPKGQSAKPKKIRGDSPTKAPKQKKPSSREVPVESHEMDGSKLAVRAGIVGIIAALLCLVFFFQSDIPSKIVAANSAKAAQMQMAAAQNPEPSEDGLEAGDSSVPPTPGLETPNEVSDDSSGVPGEDGKDGKNGKDGADGSSIVIAPGAIVDSDELSSHLEGMSSDDFTALAESIDLLIASDPEMVNLPGRKSLAEAYAEAESKYPGQIDGSKRLKLVDELNAIDYTYYVAESGDTLLALSRTFDLSLGQLVEINGIHKADEIDAGAILLFPSETVQPE